MTHAQRPTQMLYAAATGNQLQSLGNECWLCGGGGAEIPKYEFVKDTFTDHDKAKSPASEFVCAACVWCAAESNEILTARLNAVKPQKIRGYSHIVKNGVWHVFSKSHKSEMRRIICEKTDDEWLAVIADSGQKHLVFRSQISIANTALVQFELQKVQFDISELDTLVSEIETAMQFGISKNAIERGEYVDIKTAFAFGVENIKKLERVVKPKRGTGLLALALWLSQKDE